uniref:Uncharacterized protein n=1 Tax=Terrapene triunguis TaxID=2587831 RepID=A0A674IJT2_9SAUR
RDLDRSSSSLPLLSPRSFIALFLSLDVRIVGLSGSEKLTVLQGCPGIPGAAGPKGEPGVAGMKGIDIYQLKSNPPKPKHKYFHREKGGGEEDTH